MHEVDLGSRRALVSLEIEIGLYGTLASTEAYLASYKAKIGSRRALQVSTENGFQALTKVARVKEIFLCLRTFRGLALPQREAVQTSLGQSK